jgi:hypothetical protein
LTGSTANAKDWHDRQIEDKMYIASKNKNKLQESFKCLYFWCDLATLVAEAADEINCAQGTKKWSVRVSKRANRVIW